jgi:uncharacterized membrane protein
MRRLLPTLLLLAGCGTEDPNSPVAAHTPASVLASGYSQPATLPTLIGGGRGLARAINASGVAAGESQAMAGGGMVTRAVSWTGNTVTDLGWLSGDNFSSAWGINSSGTTVGRSCNASGGCRPFRRPAAGPMTSLPNLGGLNGVAYAINDAGIAVGSSDASLSTPHAVRWNVAGVITDLHPAGASWSVAYDINAGGTIVGEIVNGFGTHYAYKWNPDGTGNIISPANYSAVAISDNALITGNRPSPAASDLPFLWNPVSLFMTIPSYDSTVVTDVSYHQRLVGGIKDTAATRIGTTWGTLPLGSYTRSKASAVNTCGSVVGWAWVVGGVIRPVRWARRACD